MAALAVHLLGPALREPEVVRCVLATCAWAPTHPRLLGIKSPMMPPRSNNIDPNANFHPFTNPKHKQTNKHCSRTLVWANLVIHLLVWVVFAALLWSFFLKLLPYTLKIKVNMYGRVE
jgi:hypothetical protein